MIVGALWTSTQKAPCAIEATHRGETLAAIGAVFALLPMALGNLWLLAHGVSVGFQNTPHLSGSLLVGEAL